MNSVFRRDDRHSLPDAEVRDVHIERRLADLGLELPGPTRLPFGIPVEIEAEVVIG